MLVWSVPAFELSALGRECLYDQFQHLDDQFLARECLCMLSFSIWSISFGTRMLVWSVPAFGLWVLARECLYDQLQHLDSQLLIIVCSCCLLSHFFIPLEASAGTWEINVYMTALIWRRGSSGSSSLYQWPWWAPLSELRSWKSVSLPFVRSRVWLTFCSIQCKKTT